MVKSRVHIASVTIHLTPVDRSPTLTQGNSIYKKQDAVLSVSVEAMSVVNALLPESVENAMVDTTSASVVRVKTRNHKEVTTTMVLIQALQLIVQPTRPLLIPSLVLT